MTLSSAWNREPRRRVDDHPSPGKPLADVVVGVALENEGDALRHEGPEALARRSLEVETDRVGREALRAEPACHLAPEHRAHDTVDVADRKRGGNRRAGLERRPTQRDQGGRVERSRQAVVLRRRAVSCGARRHRRLVQDPREVEAVRLPVVHGAPHLEALRAAHHLLDVRKPSSAISSRTSWATKRMKLMTWRRVPREPLSKLGVLRRDADRAGVEMAHAHHHAAQDDERRRGEAVLLGPEQRGDHDVAPGLQLSVGLDRDAVAQPVEQQHLLGLGEPQLPRHAGVLDRAERRRPGPAVVPADQDDVGVGLRHARRDRSHADLRHELDADTGRSGWRSSGRRSARRGPRSNRCRGEAAARSGRRRAWSAATRAIHG